MSNLFDSLQNKAFSIVSDTMGYDAVWGELVARVLFNDPSKKYELAGIDFEPTGYSMEYKEGDFTGLLELVNSGDIAAVTINGASYSVLSVRKEFDGKTYVAQLSKN